MFRYSQRQYNKLLLVMGGLRIGTLHDFRRLEHNQGIADPQEGKKSVKWDVDHMVVDGEDDSNAKALKGFGINVTASDISFTNLAFVREFDQDDCFIFCTSAVGSKETMAEFEGSDSCVEIVNKDAFYSVVTEIINSFTPVRYQGFHNVRYQNKQEPWNGTDWGHHPLLIKSKQFSAQREIRGIWQLVDKRSIQPFISGDYRLGAYCREVLL